MSADWIGKMNACGQSGTPFLFILDFALLKAHVFTSTEMQAHGIRFETPGQQTPAESRERIALRKKAVSYPVYELAFMDVMQAIQAGDTYLLNLSFATPVRGVQSLEHIFLNASAPYKLLYPEKFVVFSPEQFVSIADGMIRTFPMKGTIDASIPNAAQTLLDDIKEQEEHATVVDLLRNDLSIVATEVTVDRYRFLSEIKTSDKTLLQCSSAISGKLSDGYQGQLGDIFNALLPAGSVTGAPKKKTVELIHSIEPEPRNYYTGVFGYFDGSNLDSAVMIRMIESRADGYYYRSGGGITYQSEAQLEYQEMIDKIYVPL
jgi:para-aminobenzoate synthetase component 1